MTVFPHTRNVLFVRASFDCDGLFLYYYLLILFYPVTTPVGPLSVASRLYLEIGLPIVVAVAHKIIEKVDFL